MDNHSFVDKHETHDAFLGNVLVRLMDVIEEQGNELYRDVGLSFPPRASSTILLISERDGVTTADIARELHQPHQLATQRVEALIKLGLLKRKVDPEDARRKKLILTRKGKKEASLLRVTLLEAKNMFEALYKEIEVNLSDKALCAINGLAKTSMSARIFTARSNDQKIESTNKRKIQRGTLHV
jgi:DNA-binding MarR family transcriptional regulator